MEGIIDYRIPAQDFESEAVHRALILNQLDLEPGQALQFRILRRNLDARSRIIYFVVRAEWSTEELLPVAPFVPGFQNVADRPQVHIIGSGPCGYFAALELIRLGLKPVIIERGKDVRERRRDLRSIQQFGIVHPDSNYCYGEGGAGTYSDGKLYTRSDKRGNVQDVLDLLVHHGANPDIKVDVHPHIGSNKLPGILEKIRQTILHYGGMIHFNTRLVDFVVEKNKISRIITNKEEYGSTQLILATGHSARDMYLLFREKDLQISLKAFAVGLRIEHPQSIIDEIQYKQKNRPGYLPPASYALSCQVSGKGVFSFCMCPGGLIIPAATSPGEIVVNGMSLSRRDSPFANSGMVSSVDEIDFRPYEKQGPLQGMYYQADLEKRVFDLGDGSQKAPAMRLLDFLSSGESADLPESSYIPGVYPARLQTAFPKALYSRLQAGLEAFCSKMPLYRNREAIVVATESRTSAPIKIPRHDDSLMHPQVMGLFPAGEGAGYAGGILSAAMDGQRVAQAVFKSMKPNSSQIH